MEKIEKSGKKTCTQVGESRCKMASAGRKKVGGKLPGNEKAVISLFNFLKTTEMTEREGANEKKLEWDRKHDQEGENLLQ